MTKISAIYSFHTAESYQSELGRTFSLDPLTILSDCCSCASFQIRKLRLKGKIHYSVAQSHRARRGRERERDREKERERDRDREREREREKMLRLRPVPSHCPSPS